MLHVWLRAQHSPLAIWHEDSKQWQIVDNWQQLYDIYGSKNSSKPLCLYVPSNNVLQVESELSSAQLKQLGISGKQFLFEETSLTPVEQLTIRQLSQGNSHHLYALAQSDIETWQQSAALVGMSIGALLPDFLLLPTPEEGAGQQVTLYQDRHTMLIRQSVSHGMAVSYLPLVLQRLTNLSEVCVLEPINAVENTDVQATVEGFSDLNKSEGFDLQQSPVVTEPSTVMDETAALIAEYQLLLTPLFTAPTPVEHPAREPLNFYTKSSDSQLSPYLRVAMMVALAALVLQMVTDGLQVYRYDVAQAATQTAINAQYQSWFPNERLNANTKLQIQMDAKLRSDSKSSSHMAVLQRVSPLIKQSSLQAQSLVMQPSALSFTLIASDRNSLDDFLNTLTTQGLTAKLEQISSNEQGTFSGQMTVKVQDENTQPVATTNGNDARS